MRCNKCLKTINDDSFNIIERSRYCPQCYDNFFQSDTKTLGDKILDKINNPNDKPVKTTRYGRVEFILYYFFTWFFVPPIMNILVSKNSDMQLVSVSGISGYRVDSGFTIEPSILWIVPVVLSALFASARIQDVGWSNKWSFILWLPGLSVILFLCPGTHGKNRYGAQPKKPTRINTFFAAIACMIMVLVFFLLYWFLSFVLLNLYRGVIQI